MEAPAAPAVVANAPATPIVPAIALPAMPVTAMPEAVYKRDGRREPFDPRRIERAVALCYLDLGRLPQTRIQRMTAAAVATLKSPATRVDGFPEAVAVEAVQDAVVRALLDAGEAEAASHYTGYRARHARQRAERPIPADVRAAFDEAATYFPTPLQMFQHMDKYARFDEVKGRRETWPETVDRAVVYLQELVARHTGGDLVFNANVWCDIYEDILHMRVMPSMRLLAMAGKAARRQNVSIYNCSYQPIDDVRAFSEALLISMAGCGVGYSVERRYVEKLPPVERQRVLPQVETITVEDTSEGWAAALDLGIRVWLAGGDLKFDLSAIRPAGSLLKTKGGRASGPEPLRAMLDGVRGVILARQGQRLRPLDAHDLMCLVGNAAVMGGTRRTAMISLFDHDDQEMLTCKDGDLTGLEHRFNANNSSVWPDRGITREELEAQFAAMDAGGRGEPGIFNRAAAVAMRPAGREEAEFGTNPCGEIILRPFQLCNLSVAVARPDDDIESLVRKVRTATTIGCIQSLADHFPGLRPEWRENAVRERLLGVDITGQMDCPLLRDDQALVMHPWGASDDQYRTAMSPLHYLREEARLQAQHIATMLKINVPAAITCVKPSGNSSQLLNTSSGLHPRHSRYYIRHVRVGAATPIAQVLREAGVPMTAENGQPADNPATWVVAFPVAAPASAVVRADVSALDQCRHWLYNKLAYTEHNPSVTISYKPEELAGVVDWVWAHRDEIGGMSFLPFFDARYDLMPYQEISEAEYLARAAVFPTIDFSKLWYYEASDETTAAQELACVAGLCEL